MLRKKLVKRKEKGGGEWPNFTFQKEERSRGPTATGTIVACGFSKGFCYWHSERCNCYCVTDATQESAIGDIFLRINAKRQSPPGLAQLSVPTPTPFLPLQNYPLQVLLQTGFKLFHHNHSLKSLDQIH